VTDPAEKTRRDALLATLTEKRREVEARRRQAFERQVSGDAAGDSEGVHGWKASREGGADVAMLEMLDQSLRQIDAAIARLHSGTYGVCAACGAPIPVARLRAVPFATHCAPCQEGREGHGPGGGRTAS
jgi:RNA polymerase-binding transcription factor DksA